MTAPVVLHRMFVASPTDVVLVELTAGMSQAMDVLDAAGMLSDRSVKLLAAAERDGRDVVHFAHHLVSLASVVHRAPS